MSAILYFGSIVVAWIGNWIYNGRGLLKALTFGGAVLSSTGFMQWMQRRPPAAVNACLYATVFARLCAKASIIYAIGLFILLKPLLVSFAAAMHSWPRLAGTV